ncbi:hypothetical protein PsYK624_065990 [Phanerochaete sordida]|uniref:Uncharacterized protein n=1 Tax=Phanerochaete sordida TaxID=48140 RepID=A0A9P3LDK6_9APHY|nr:hypothetical protein PsYK624_065990 [Phanerochaete sordida]
MASLAQILPSVLMNHFIINLRTLPPSGADARPDPTWLRPRTLSTMSFPMPPFLGNIGEELVHGDAPDPEDGSEELLMQDLDSLTDDSVSSAGTAASPRREPEDIELRYV